VTRPVRLALAGVLALCAALRVAVLASPLGRLDGDEAVSGIMAQRIVGAAGTAPSSWDERLPLYFAGDGYLGAGEQYLQAPLLALAPTSPMVLRLPMVLLAVATCALVAVLARRVLGRPGAGVMAAALFAVGPFFSLVWSIRSRQTSLALAAGTAGLVLALGAAGDDPRARLRAAAFGACCGVGFWMNWTAAFLLLPAGLWWLGATRGAWARVLPPAALAFLAGSGPFWVTLASGRVPLFLTRDPPESTPWERLQGLAGPIGGMFLGVREAPPAGARAPVADWLPPWVVVGAAAALVLWGVVRRRRGLAAMARLRTDGGRAAARASDPGGIPGPAGAARPGDALLLVALLTPVIYAAASFAWYDGEPRYLFPLYAVLPVGLAALVPWGRRGAGVVAVALVGLLAASSVHGAVLTLRRDGLGPATLPAFVQTEDLPAVVDVLEAEGVEAVYADYWLAYPLQFVAGDHVAVSSWYTPRFDDDAARVRAVPSPGWAAARGRPAEELTEALDATGARYRRREVGSVSLFLDVTPGLQPTDRSRDPRETGLAPSG